MGGLLSERGFCGVLRGGDGPGEMHHLQRQKVRHYSTNQAKKRRFARRVESLREGWVGSNGRGQCGAYYVLYATEGGSDPRSPKGRGRSAAQKGGSLPPF